MIVDKPKKKKKKMSRYTVFTIIMGIVFTMITSKLLYLQIYKHEDYKDKANTTSIRFVSENAPRGKIYDKNGNVLATNTQTYTVTYTSTDDANKEFYSTLNQVLSILRENGDNFQDDLILKLNEDDEWFLEYKTSDVDLQKSEEIRFKRDRGLNEEIEKELLPNKAS